MTPRPFFPLASLGLAAALLLGGCAALPGPEAPLDRSAPLVPASLPAGGLPSASGLPSAASTEPTPWRSLLRDARLAQLTELALQHNADLRTARLSLDAARVQVRSAAASRWPSLTASLGGSATGTRSSVTRQTSATVGVSGWELDLWGRQARLQDAAEASAQASAASLASVQASVVSALAQAWLGLAADSELLRLAEDTLASRQRSSALARQRQALGVATGLDVSAAEGSEAAAQAQVLSLRTTRAQDLNALRLLVGAEPPAALLPDSRLASADEAAALPAVPAELPSSVLLRRPDVQAAEAALQAGEADLAAARAALFPTLSLTSSVGSASPALSGLFGSGTGIWTFVPSLKLPLLDGGASLAGLDSVRIARAKALVSYEQTVQTAFREAADALALRADIAQRLSAQQQVVDASARSLALTQRRHEAGAETALAVLDAQRSLWSAQQTLVSLRLSEQVNRLTLWKVLGGA